MKTIQLKESNWKKLSKMKLKYNLKTMDNLISVILTVMKDFQPELNKESKK